MFGLGKPKLPIIEEQRHWIDGSFSRLASLLGPESMLEAQAVTPTPEYFPEPYDGSEEALNRMFLRVAAYMGVDPDSVELRLFDDTSDKTRSLVPYYSGSSQGAGGFYLHQADAKTELSINASQLANPMSLVATLAHELGHVILLRPGLVDREEKDMEPLNDLLTVFLGFGVFNANAAFHFQQFSSLNGQGWSTQRLGYLPEEMFGYGLARFAFERGETKPSWAKYLSTNPLTYFRRSLDWLMVNGRILDVPARP